MPASYLQLRERVDGLGASIARGSADRIACEEGCCDCCIGGLTLVAVEAVVLGEELGLTRNRVHDLVGTPSAAETGRCALLDRDGRCTAYASRPIVCRTEGLPLAYPEPAGIVTCKKNFVGVTPDRAAAFDMTNLETALFAVNLDYCKRYGLDPLGRVAIDRLNEVAEINPPHDG